MRLLALIIIFFALEVYGAEEVSINKNVNFDARASFVSRKFQETLYSDKENITYNRVPRGLIVSISAKKLFQEGSSELTESGKEFLRLIAEVLNTFNNNCAIESHTDENMLKSPEYQEEWEISIHRANVITAYLMECCDVMSERLYPIGFGDVMPFWGNVAKSDFTDNRIDFVIFDYTARR